MKLSAHETKRKLCTCRRGPTHGVNTATAWDVQLGGATHALGGSTFTGRVEVGSNASKAHETAGVHIDTTICTHTTTTPIRARIHAPTRGKTTLTTRNTTGIGSHRVGMRTLKPYNQRLQVVVDRTP